MRDSETPSNHDITSATANVDPLIYRLFDSHNHITTGFRQTFDFLGYMWAPILTNFLNIVFNIFGFFGAYQYRPAYILSTGDALSMGTGSASWWEVNGPGCRASFSANLTGEDVLRPLRPERVTGCLLPYEVIEVLQAAVQVVLALLAVLTGLWVAKAMLEEDDTLPASKSRPASLYSIEFSSSHHHPHHQPAELLHPHTPERLSMRAVPIISLPVGGVDAARLPGMDAAELEEDEEDGPPGAQRSKPMTPRRVKRRSGSRGSVRSASHQRHSNPVTRLLDQQQLQQQQHERHLVGHCNPTYQSSSNQSLDRPASSYSNYHGQRPVSLRATAQVPTPNTLRHSYRRHMHQAPPPYNGHQHNYPPDSETVI
ncbi:hypothetical protein B566_EDAN012839 [Ephemera danica]|nr:hypothetical protein B566_EDAN012839 [Ephemera danica]